MLGDVTSWPLLPPRRNRTNCLTPTINGMIVEKAVEMGHVGPQIGPKSARITQRLTAQAGVKARHQQRGGDALATDAANRDT